MYLQLLMGIEQERKLPPYEGGGAEGQREDLTEADVTGQSASHRGVEELRASELELEKERGESYEI